MQTLTREASRKITWHDIPIGESRGKVRSALILKHGDLTTAAEKLEIPYIRLSGALCGRENLIYVISAIQTDLELSDTQVLALWPLLKQWPKTRKIS